MSDLAAYTTNTGQEFTGTFVEEGKVGPIGPKGDKGDKGDKGEKPIRGIDYFTQDDINQMVYRITDDANSVFNENVAEKTTAFNTNASNKTTDYNTNATNKTSAYNGNASDKLDAFNSNYTTKNGAFNDNYDTKLGAFNDNATSKTNTFNQNATDKTTAFNNNASSKTGDYNDNATLKTTAFNNNASDKTDAYNSNATLKTTAYNDNATDKTTAFNNNAQAKQDAFDENAESIQEQLDLIISNYDQATNEPSSDIHLTDSLNGYNQGIVIDGNSIQVQSTGKNIFDGEVTEGYWSVTVGEELTSNSSSSTQVRCKNKIEVKPNTTYTFSIDGEVNTINTRYVYADANNIVLSSEAIATGIITTPADAKYLVFHGTQLRTTYGLYFPSPMIEEGSTVTSYEPYTDGLPTPTPTKSSPIVDVTGTQEVVARNKNLLEPDAYPAAAGSTYIKLTNKTPVISPYITQQTYTGIAFIAKVIAGKTYTLSEDISGLNYRMVGIYAEKSHITNQSKILQFITLSTTNKTFRSNYSGYAVIGGTSPTANKTISWTYAQLERGSTTTDFIPHKGSTHQLRLGDIHLRGIGEYKDKIYKENGKWYLKQAIGEITLDGTETWAVTTNWGDNSFYVTLADLNINVVAFEMVLSNYFKGYASSTTKQLNNEIVIGRSSLIINNPDISTADELETWLSTHNTIVDYVMTNPTPIEITDTDLLADLEDLITMQTYKSETNIMVTPAEGNTGNPAQLEVTYLKDDRVSKEDFELLKARVDLLEE